MNLIEFYKDAETEVIKKGYTKEITMVECRKFEDQTPRNLFFEFVYVVCNSGMKNQVAEKIYANYIKNGISAINHPNKKKAIQQGEIYYEVWFKMLNDRGSDEERLEYLETLPHIGKITKYHLARNLGIDCAKPDRHLMRLADQFGYSDVQEMCKAVSEATGDRIGTVDVVLWRYCNLCNNESNKGGAKKRE